MLPLSKSSVTRFRLRNRHFLLLDVVLLLLAGVLSYVVRLEEFNLTDAIHQGFLLYLVVAIPIRIAALAMFGVYQRYWVHAGPDELLQIGYAGVTSSALVIAFAWILNASKTAYIPRSLPFIDSLIVLLMITATRFAPRAYYILVRRTRVWRYRHATGESPVVTTQKRLLILGAGQAGAYASQSLLSDSESPVEIIGFLDDDPRKQNMIVRGVRVLGTLAELPAVAARERINLIVIAMPSVGGKVMRDVVRQCQLIDVPYKTLPGIQDVINGRVSLSRLRPVSIDDLLGRPSVQLNVSDIQRQVAGRVVLITGAGGSIGGEIAWQLAAYAPKCLLLLGRGENSLYATESRLRLDYPHLNYQLILADIRDMRRMKAVFEQHQPQVIFHAAAHKHVPMLENNAAEAAQNNVIGTSNIIVLANRYKVERVTMISTDKAVSPTSIMGMTKRTAELMVIKASQENPGRFAVVRFGNVLGSRGSVVPLFQQQIAAGKPITVTSAEITRFFMSIPEAVRLVLKASTLVNKGAIFVLNMGEPVRIIDLAHDLIRLSGLTPNDDVPIHITGLRPGEKLYEELFWDYEEREPVENGALFAVHIRNERTQRAIEAGITHIPQVMRAALDYDDVRVRDLLKLVVFAAPMAAAPIGINLPKAVNAMPLGSSFNAANATMSAEHAGD